MRTTVMGILSALLLMGGVAPFVIDQRAEAETKSIEKLKSYSGPGLGEIMGIIQQHHAKLFFAGQAENWRLAQYQLDEIKEGFETAERLHPNFKTISTPLPKIIPAMMAKSLDNLETDIQQKNREAFIKNFDAFTDACNNCHIAAKYDFIVIQRPSAPEYSNMTFDIKKTM